MWVDIGVNSRVNFVDVVIVEEDRVVKKKAAEEKGKLSVRGATQEGLSSYQKIVRAKSDKNFSRNQERSVTCLEKGMLVEFLIILKSVS